MERKKLIFWTGASLITLGFVFQIGETWYFGWNLQPESFEEAACDFFFFFASICRNDRDHIGMGDNAADFDGHARCEVRQ